MNYALLILAHCQNVLAMIGAELAISENIFLQFLKNTQPGRGKIFPSCIQKPFFKLTFRVIPIINFDSDDRYRNKIEAPVHMEVDREFLSNVKDEMISLAFSCPVNASGEPTKPHF